MSEEHARGSHNEDDSDRPKWKADTKLVASYEYQKADGAYSFTVDKGLNELNGSGREKVFRITRKNLKNYDEYTEPEDFKPFYIGMGDEKPVLYRLPELIAALKANSETLVLIVEGEKDVETARSLGFVATCNPFGAGKWRDEFSTYLTGARVAVIPDTDPDAIGQTHATKVAHSVVTLANQVKWLPMPNGIKDLTEWVEAERASGVNDFAIKTKLQSMIHQAKAIERVAALTLEDWLTRELPKSDFICGQWLTTTSRTIIDADTGMGKTLLLIALTMNCSVGKPFLHWKPTRPSRVLYIDGEMPARSIKQRLIDEARRIGITQSEGFHLLSHEDVPDGVWAPLNSEAGQDLIEKYIKSIAALDLIVFDNIMSLIAGDQKDEEGWRQTLPWVRSLTRRHIAQIWVHHTGHDASRAYGTKTREWQMDNVIHLDKVERADTDVSFLLKFTKARERTPETRNDFVDATIALANDQWRWEIPTGGRQGKLTPMGAKFYDCLCKATEASGRQFNGKPAASFDEWRKVCRSYALIDGDKPDSSRTLFSKYRRELMEKNWIACNVSDTAGEMAWTLGPNSSTIIPF